MLKKTKLEKELQLGEIFMELDSNCYSLNFDWLCILRLGSFALVLVAAIVFAYLALPCLFRYIDCGDKGQCENMFNGYRCLCGDGAIKIDESDPQSSCVMDYCYGVDCGRGECQVSSNDYICQCESGLRYIQIQNCDLMIECFISNKGFKQNSENKTCEDMNECDADKYTCGGLEGVFYGTCENSEGTHACYCNEGFQNRNELDSECLDIDECTKFGCGIDSKCINTIGSYQCECGDGYEHENEWEACQDIDECSIVAIPPEPDYCQDGECSNYPGGYDCTCPSYSFEVYHDGPNNVMFCGNNWIPLKWVLNINFRLWDFSIEFIRFGKFSRHDWFIRYDS